MHAFTSSNTKYLLGMTWEHCIHIAIQIWIIFDEDTPSPASQISSHILLNMLCLMEFIIRAAFPPADTRSTFNVQSNHLQVIDKVSHLRKISYSCDSQLKIEKWVGKLGSRKALSIQCSDSTRMVRPELR